MSRMKIGIIVRSNYGHTLEVARKLEKKLRKGGKDVTLEEVKLAGEFKNDQTEFEFKKPLPDLEPYDVIVFGSSVQAFSLSLPMQQYFDTVKTLKKKKVVILITQFFPFQWMGGNRTVRQTRKICEQKGARVLGSGIVNWAGENRRKKKMNRVVKELAGML